MSLTHSGDEARERPKEVRRLAEEIRRIDVVDLLSARSDEFALPARNPEKVQSEIHILFQLRSVLISELREVVRQADAGTVDLKKVREGTEELEKFRNASVEQVETLLKDQFSETQFNAIVDGFMRACPQNYYHCEFLAKQLDLTDEQIQKLHGLRRAEILIINGVDRSGENPFAAVAARLGAQRAKAADVLTEEQLEIVWKAQKLWKEGEDVEKFLARFSGNPGGRRFIKESKALTQKWDEIFPNTPL
ncbi:hypothetical protein K227x_53440 [Rubripirellula lacrimiformis]|uniref:Uncharacterized protein n=1 Tax=Rubripirellula lacrimiformis TaxID=1930273 RepID=A0A517NIG1_9BACT|nr:hypothetical protein [Rubripirellula lacrimiformis]QDT06920.1 hypothetical protein K227x_53440 [Rubripirellula lacrimiformis]